MTRTTGPDCAVMCNLINTHTTHTHIDDGTGLRGYVKFNKYTHIHARTYTQRIQERVGNNKEAGGEAQYTQGLSKSYTSRESVSSLSHPIKGFRISIIDPPVGGSMRVA